MPLPWYWEIILSASAIGCAYIAYRRGQIFAMLVWANIALYYALVYAGALSQETRHLYGRLNMAFIIVSNIFPYVIAHFRRHK